LKARAEEKSKTRTASMSNEKIKELLNSAGPAFHTSLKSSMRCNSKSLNEIT
jgi:hypothetical protein